MADEKGADTPQEVATHKGDQELRVVDNPLAPVISVDGFAGLLVRDHTVKINLTHLQGGHPRANPAAQEVVVARLSMSTAALSRIFHVFSATVERMQKEGVVPYFDPETETFDWRPEDAAGDGEKE